MSDQRRKVLSFGPFELSIGNRLLTNGAKVTRAPLISSPRGGKTEGLRA